MAFPGAGFTDPKSSPPTIDRDAPHPAQIRQIRAGIALRGVTTPVPRVLLSTTLTGPTPSGSADAPRLCRGCSHPPRHLPDQAAPSYARPLRRPDDDGLSPPLEQQRLTAHEAGTQRILDHLRRPVPGRGDLLTEDAGNTVSEIDPAFDLTSGWRLVGWAWFPVLPLATWRASRDRFVAPAKQSSWLRAARCATTHHYRVLGTMRHGCPVHPFPPGGAGHPHKLSSRTLAARASSASCGEVEHRRADDEDHAVANADPHQISPSLLACLQATLAVEPPPVSQGLAATLWPGVEHPARAAHCLVRRPGPGLPLAFRFPVAVLVGRGQ